MVKIVFRDHLIHDGKHGLIYEITTHPKGIPIDELEEYEAITVYKRSNGDCYVKHSSEAMDSDLLKEGLSVPDAIEYARDQVHKMEGDVETDSNGRLAESEQIVDLSTL